ncbi:hypothetical protein ACSBR2_041548 [Camellia fascicularis]
MNMLPDFDDMGMEYEDEDDVEINVTQLKKVVKHTEDLMKNYKEDCAKYERSVMADGWTDKREKTLINFLVNCSKETMFVELVDASSYSKDRKKLFKLLDKFVEKVEKENVIPQLKKTFERGIAIHDYIYNRPTLLNMII